jgi:hypothetical protein
MIHIRKFNENNENLSPIAKFIMSEIDYATENYGEDAFEYPDEIMDMQKIIDDLKVLSPDEIANILIQVLDNYPKISKFGSNWESEQTVETITYLLGNHDGDFPGCLSSNDMKKIASFDKRLKNGW